ncbi:uncharacterized protein PV07_02806 [Cladophialophora immunda]|uniref:Uncharacterized protein n=1 Tax=Cladophialophora immunda TaxID=569365 RepID=A0A0D2B0M9_9EURO|nr:uncharacterized protein PV07_02806 [Cladophialophora immunda]KIW31132.1 hypothetical protein PV07_02806 [Cladophialophora immunda]
MPRVRSTPPQKICIPPCSSQLYGLCGIRRLRNRHQGLFQRTLRSWRAALSMSSEVWRDDGREAARVTYNLQNKQPATPSSPPFRTKAFMLHFLPSFWRRIRAMTISRMKAPQPVCCRWTTDMQVNIIA